MRKDTNMSKNGESGNDFCLESAEFSSIKGIFFYLGLNPTNPANKDDIHAAYLTGFANVSRTNGHPFSATAISPWFILSNDARCRRLGIFSDRFLRIMRDIVMYEIAQWRLITYEWEIEDKFELYRIDACSFIMCFLFIVKCHKSSSCLFVHRIWRAYLVPLFPATKTNYHSNPWHDITIAIFASAYR